MTPKQINHPFIHQGITHQDQLDRKDYGIALILSLLALVAYVRTLAPDILYGDSAEFQCLAYTFGVTHSTGYPTYLFLARLIGFMPFNNPAWRVSLFSAITAGITVGGVYLLACYFTRDRIGPLLGGLALSLSYTFWAQAIIAEVYTPGMAFLILVIALLFHWQVEPQKRSPALLAAALLAGIGFGVHASVWLLAPPAVILVIWRLWKQRASRQDWKKSISYAAAGTILGLIIFLFAFMISDRLNSPTSFIRTTLEPSRIFWNLEKNDFNTSFKHLKLTVISAQWGHALFPGGDFSFSEEWNIFLERLTSIEFSSVVLLFALLGIVIMLFRFTLGGVFFILHFLFSLFFILNYQVGDKYVFYLPLYIPLTIALGTGMGWVLEWGKYFLEPLPTRSSQILYLLPILFFLTMVLQPAAGVRWQALRLGKADFVSDTYPYPVYDLGEPRLVAEQRLAGISSDAVYVLNWRTLYTTAYLAHVENGMTNTLFFEAMPYGNNGKVAPTLITQLIGYLEEDRPVFTDHRYPGLEGQFRLLPISGDLYRLTLPK